jgi:hypothetical protein
VHHWQARRVFNRSVLARIEQAIAAGEATHSGQMRFAVEGALDGAALLRDQTEARSRPAPHRRQLDRRRARRRPVAVARYDRREAPRAGSGPCLCSLRTVWGRAAFPRARSACLISNVTYTLQRQY